MTAPGCCPACTVEVVDGACECDPNFIPFLAMTPTHPLEHLWLPEHVTRSDASTLHVRPLNDLIEHLVQDDCPCGPTTEAVMRPDGSNGWLVVHHSLDGREQVIL